MPKASRDFTLYQYLQFSQNFIEYSIERPLLMETKELADTEHFSQTQIKLDAGKSAGQQEPLDIDQTLYVLNGVGVIETPLETYPLTCRSFIRLPRNTPYNITNTEKISLTFILTQSKL